MPFDGTCLPRSPLAVLLEADRKLTIAKRAAAKMRPRLVPFPGDLVRRTMKARESIVVLDLLDKLFDGGENWCQNQLHDGRGNRCLVGMLQYVRAVRGAGDHAGVYLSRAIQRFYGQTGKIINFNDNRSSYAEIRAAIVLARELAQRVIDSH